MNQPGITHLAVQWVIQHGYLLLAAAVFAEQIGVPVPAAPILLAMGALCGLERFSFGWALAICASAAVVADVVWFELGRRQGESILSRLCRMSLEPDTCVNQTHRAFDRFGQASLLFCKFVPGLGTVAPPLAGSSGISMVRFLLLDLAGATVWAGTYLTVGWIFRRELEDALQILERFGVWMFVALAAPLALYLLWKYAQRQVFLRKLDVERIQPRELMAMAESENPPLIIDLRSARTIKRSGLRIRGARAIAPDEIQVHLRDLPAGAHLVFYCT